MKHVEDTRYPIMLQVILTCLLYVASAVGGSTDSICATEAKLAEEGIYGFRYTNCIVGGGQLDRSSRKEPVREVFRYYMDLDTYVLGACGG